MPFNSQSGKEAGKISKRSSALPLDLRSGLHQLVNAILNDLDYHSLTASQKIKLLDVALKHSLPRLTIEKQFKDFEETEISIINSEGKVIETIKKKQSQNRLK